MSDSETLACYTWLLKTSQHLHAIRSQEPLLVAITDAFLELTGGERAYLWLSEAGPNALLPMAARGRQGAQIAPAERRAHNAAKRALAEPDAPQVTEDGDAGHSQAAAVLQHEGQSLGVVYAEGAFKPDWAGSAAIGHFARTAALALDNARLLERASNDLLTGLPNNSAFMGALDKALRSLREQDGCGIVLLDLDAFKRVNVAAGADVGDRTLIDVAHTLRDTLGADGLVARFGSDKFAVLLSMSPYTGMAVRLWDVAERARAAVGAKISGGIQLSCSIAGVATLTAPTVAGVSPARALVTQCDQLLSKLRRTGAGKLEIVVPVAH